MAVSAPERKPYTGFQGRRNVSGVWGGLQGNNRGLMPASSNKGHQVIW